MVGPQWDDEMKFELFRLKSELRSENFRVLAPPLGLGKMKLEAAALRRAEKSLYPSPQPQTSSHGGLFPTPVQVKTLGSPALKSPVTVKTRISTAPSFAETEETELFAIAAPLLERKLGPWTRASHFLLAHILDLSFVGLSLVLGFVVLGLILDPGHMSLTPEGLLEAVPMQILRKIEGWALLAGVYLIFALYWIFFKLVSGSTLGETCVNNFWSRPSEMAAAQGNASAET